MSKALPTPPRRNAPWTPLQRRTWLAEQRHKKSLLPAPVLRAVYPDLLAWDWDLPNPAHWNIWVSLDGGATYTHPSDYQVAGDVRQFAPDGGGERHYIVGVDATGTEITLHSNYVRPDDGVPPLDAPTLVRVGGFYIGTATVTTSVWQFAQTDSRYYDGPVQDWADGADISDASYTLLPPNQAQSPHLFSFCACRYQFSGVWSPWCAVIESD